MSLHYLEHKSYAQIATLLTLPLGTVKSHISRGRKLLDEAQNPSGSGILIAPSDQFQDIPAQG
jgi:DNA-directed RNA polymerase specialized sigma24 family protein